MDKNQEHTKYYNGNGVEVPSCTSVVKLLNKPELVGWANYMGFRRINTTRFLQQKAEYGTYCHQLAEYYLNGIMLANEEVPLYIDQETHLSILSKLEAIGNQFNESGIVILGMELQMHGARCGGTLDLLAHLPSKNRLILLDFKTSKSVYDSHLIQLGGYSLLLEETLGLSVTDVGIILLSKEPSDENFINLLNREENRVNEKIFEKLLDIYWLKYGEKN